VGRARAAKPFAPAESLVEAARREGKIVLYTATFVEVEQEVVNEFRKRFPLIDLFDVIVDATYTKILKPDPRAYEQVLSELGLPREACVFVDDQKKNIEGAEAVGLPHVHFDVTRPAESYARALAMLGL